MKNIRWILFGLLVSFSAIAADVSTYTFHPKLDGKVIAVRLAKKVGKVFVLAYLPANEGKTHISITRYGDGKKDVVYDRIYDQAMDKSTLGLSVSPEGRHGVLVFGYRTRKLLNFETGTEQDFALDEKYDSFGMSIFMSEDQIAIVVVTRNYNPTKELWNYQFSTAEKKRILSFEEPLTLWDLMFENVPGRSLIVESYQGHSFIFDLEKGIRIDVNSKTGSIPTAGYPVSQSPNLVFYRPQYQHPDKLDVWIFDSAKAEFKKLLIEGYAGELRSVTASGVDEIFLATEKKTAVENAVLTYAYSISSGNLKLLFEDKSGTSSAPPVTRIDRTHLLFWSSDGNTILDLTNMEKRHHQLVSFPTGKGFTYFDHNAVLNEERLLERKPLHRYLLDSGFPRWGSSLVPSPNGQTAFALGNELLRLDGATGVVESVIEKNLSDPSLSDSERNAVMSILFDYARQEMVRCGSSLFIFDGHEKTVAFDAGSGKFKKILNSDYANATRTYQCLSGGKTFLATVDNPSKPWMDLVDTDTLESLIPDELKALRNSSRGVDPTGQVFFVSASTENTGEMINHLVDLKTRKELFSISSILTISALSIAEDGSLVAAGRYRSDDCTFISCWFRLGWQRWSRDGKLLEFKRYEDTDRSEPSVIGGRWLFQKCDRIFSLESKDFVHPPGQISFMESCGKDGLRWLTDSDSLLFYFRGIEGPINLWSKDKFEQVATIPAPGEGSIFTVGENAVFVVNGPGKTLDVFSRGGSDSLGHVSIENKEIPQGLSVRGWIWNFTESNNERYPMAVYW